MEQIAFQFSMMNEETQATIPMVVNTYIESLKWTKI